MWEIGEQCICVNARPMAGSSRFHCKKLTQGKIYIIRDLKQADLFPDQAALMLEEIPGIWYFEYRFRPLKKTKTQTDISIFTKLLDGLKNPDGGKIVKKKVKEDA